MLADPKLPQTTIPSIEAIDAEWILGRMRDHRGGGYQITVDLWITLPLPSGEVTVSRKTHLTPDEVLGVLAARKEASNG